MTEKKSRTNTMESSPLSPEEAAAGLDPLIQPISAEEGEPVYLRRQSSIFYVPASKVNENADQNDCGKQTNIFRKCLNYTERCSGIMYALLSSFLFSCSNFALVQLKVTLFDVLAVRFSILAFISFGFITYKGYKIYPGWDGPLLLMRSFFAAGGSICFYLALSFIPFPDLTTVRYTQVIWTALLALIIFHERLTLPTVFASILTLIGVVFVAQPTFLFASSKIVNVTSSENVPVNETKQRLIGMLIAVSCALAISMSIVLNKKLLQKQVRQSLIMFYFFCTTAILLLSIQTYSRIVVKSKSSKFDFQKAFFNKNFLFATIISLLQLCPMMLSQKAIKREHPSIVTVVQSSDIIFAIILQNTFSSIKTNLLALLGSLLVIASIFIVGGYKLWLDRQNRMCVPTSAPNEEFSSVEIKK
ncbi:unnamed protein product [Adineta ricciae]|uniref:EamA domain-containing protein n=1 Tax=Adineta ricciae TaxID=249248 RepID=A0A813RMG5_ADIRI|nr:unnamed protein product [Adineta ricciae]